MNWMALALCAQGFEEKKLAAWPEDVDMITFSPAGSRVAFRAFKDGKQFVVVNDQKGPEYDEVQNPGFAPDGETVFYKARRGNQWRVVWGDRVSEDYDRIDGAAIGGDGRLAFSARRGPDQFLILEGRPAGREYGFADWPVFSPDSKHLAFRSCVENRWNMILDGKKLGDHDEVAWAAFGPDSRFRYLARTGETWHVLGGENRIAVAGKAPEFLTLGQTKFAYKSGGRVFLDDIPGEEYDQIRGWTIAFSPGGDRLAYAAEQRGRWFVVVGEKRFSAGDDVMDVVWSADGRAVAYSGREGKKHYVSVAGQRYGEFDWAERVAFSADRSKVGVGAVIGREFWWKVFPLR
jgi:hypothetical protein